MTTTYYFTVSQFEKLKDFCKTCVSQYVQFYSVDTPARKFFRDSKNMNHVVECKNYNRYLNENTEHNIHNLTNSLYMNAISNEGEEERKFLKENGIDITKQCI